MSLEALLANFKPYDVRLHQLRGFPGAVCSAKSIMKCVEGSDLLFGKIKTKVQDAYSMRSTPQGIGDAHDAVAFARAQVETELNTAIKNGQILENAWGILGIELMAAAQALDFREFTPGRGVQAARRVVRKYVDHLAGARIEASWAR